LLLIPLSTPHRGGGVGGRLRGVCGGDGLSDDVLVCVVLWSSVVS
jgi:hypothetical protein